MATAEFPSNNGGPPAKKEEESSIKQPKMKQITTSRVIQKKEGMAGRVAKSFFVGDDMRTVAHYAVFEILIPAAKGAITDSVSQGLERMLFGEVRRRPSTASRGGSSTGYTNYASRGRAFAPDEPNRSLSRQDRATHNFGNIIIEDRGEAEQVLDDLQAVIDQYDVASITTLFDMVGISGTYVDDKWGWTDLQGARTERVSGGGYALVLPKPIALD